MQVNSNTIHRNKTESIPKVTNTTHVRVPVISNIEFLIKYTCNLICYSDSVLCIKCLDDYRIKIVERRLYQKRLKEKIDKRDRKRLQTLLHVDQLQIPAEIIVIQEQSGNNAPVVTRSIKCQRSYNFSH